MIYSDFKNLKLSALGLGCMRLPVMDGDNSKIDIEATEEMIAYAMDHGINYYDTAWGYHSGNSEIVSGQLLNKYPRNSFYLASKFPGYDISTFKKKEEIFEKQLKKCGVDYFDFYLFHNVYGKNIEYYLDSEYGIFDYLIEQKRMGRIKHLGFSTHGTLDVMRCFLDAYGHELEFCQIQLNWLDWEFQNAKEKVELLEEYNIPIWVMEPVRGGGLVRLSDKNEAILKKLQPDRTMPEWAFRFIQSIDSVKMTLSGMSNMQQLKDNIATFEKRVCLSEKEKNTLIDIGISIASRSTVHCTGCRYCTAHCPQGLDIPSLIDQYNEYCSSGKKAGLFAEENQLSDCIGCRGCEAVCPQRIKISEVLADFKDKLKI